MSRRVTPLTASESDIHQLEKLVDGPSPVAARAASVLLTLIKDPDVDHAVEVTGMGKTEIYKWRKIYMEEGISGILNLHLGRHRIEPDDQIIAYLDSLPADADRDADEIAQRFGISTKELYDVLERHDVSLMRTTVWHDPTSDVLGYDGPYFAGYDLSETEKIRCGG